MQRFTLLILSLLKSQKPIKNGTVNSKKQCKNVLTKNTLNINERDKMNINEIEEETTPLRDELERHIRKLVHPLKDESELKDTLKVKLTKKEFKVLNTWANNLDLEALKEKLDIDEERYGELSVKLIKKLNQEKLKQLICI